MKFILTIFLFLSVTSFAIGPVNHYVSSTGNDSNPGTLISPWRTIAKVNSSMGVINPGDSVLFERGGTYAGGLIMTKNGTVGSPIVFGSYGTGAKPIISGMTALTGWSNVTGSIWECTASTLKSSVNIFTIGGTPYDVGRTPNAGSAWYAYDTGASRTTTSIVSLTAVTAPIGGEVVLKKDRFTLERQTIQSQTGNKITFAPVAGIDNKGGLSARKATYGYGYFFQRFAASLDQNGEWYYNKGANKMRVFSTVNPASLTIKASYIDTLFTLGDRTNITVSNLSFEGAGNYAIESNLGSGILVKDCDFNNNTRAVYIWNSDDATVTRNTVNNSLNAAIFVVNRQRKRILITNNTVTNTGLLYGAGCFPSTYNLKAIVGETDSTQASNSVKINYNLVLNTGYMGIQFQGSNVEVAYNYVSYFCMSLDDGGGIYSFINNTSVNHINYFNREVHHNFISYAIGSPVGTNSSTPDVAGYYMDDQVQRVYAHHNTIWNIPGNACQMNNPLNMTFTDNIIYNCDFAFSVNMKPYGPLSGNRITRNTIYQMATTQYNFFHSNSNLSFPSAITITQSMQNMAYIDSNKITNLKTAGYKYYYSATGGAFTFPADINLATWRSTYGHDLATTLPPITVTTTNTRIVINASDSVRNESFYGKKEMTSDGVNYDNSINIPRWSSVILIDNGSVTNIAPTANAGGPQVITLPQSSTNVTGAASSDLDGTISSYAWAKISGPTGGTISTAGTVSTAITALQQGIYVFRLTVTDNLGATGVTTVQITVNAANTAPLVNAGADSTVDLPKSTVTLIGTASDPGGSISAYSWAKISGPAGGNITSPTFSTTQVTGLQQGRYTFKLTVTDNGSLTASDDVDIIVNPIVPPVNNPPTIDSIPVQSTTLPKDSVTLTAVATDIDGTISSYSWTKIFGTGSTISSPGTATTKITGLTAGDYYFKIKVVDNSGDSATRIAHVIVNAANIKPSVSAGEDRVISLPKDTVKLLAVATDADGTIASFSWLKLSGPAGGTISSTSTAATDITGLTEGVHVYQVTVADNAGDTTSDAVQITVNAMPVNTVPVPDAGPDTTILLPVNTTTLTGSGLATSPGATISSYAWVITVNPGSATLGSASSATTSLDNLTEGKYTIELTITDSNGMTAKDSVIITVDAAAPPPSRAILLFHVRVKP